MSALPPGDPTDSLDVSTGWAMQRALHGQAGVHERVRRQIGRPAAAGADRSGRRRMVIHPQTETLFHAEQPDQKAKWAASVVDAASLAWRTVVGGQQWKVQGRGVVCPRGLGTTVPRTRVIESCAKVYY